jgi:hypothetical protein
MAEPGPAKTRKGAVAMARIAMSEIQKAEIAAQLGADEALFDLGLIYSTGRDVEQDLITAHKWFNLAALRGNSAARDYRTEIARELSSMEVAEAQRQAREWLHAH